MKFKKPFLYHTIRLLCLSVFALTLTALWGCSSSSGEHKDGEKFPSTKPPADFVAEAMRKRNSAPPPGPQASKTPPAGAAKTGQ